LLIIHDKVTINPLFYVNYRIIGYWYEACYADKQTVVLYV